MNVILKYFVRFSYTSILLIFVVIDCSIIGMLYSYIMIIDQGLILYIALLVIIISIDRNGLFCSSTSLNDTLNNPTPFCTLSGS